MGKKSDISNGNIAITLLFFIYVQKEPLNEKILLCRFLYPPQTLTVCLFLILKPTDNSNHHKIFKADMKKRFLENVKSHLTYQTICIRKEGRLELSQKYFAIYIMTEIVKKRRTFLQKNLIPFFNFL